MIQYSKYCRIILPYPPQKSKPSGQKTFFHKICGRWHELPLYKSGKNQYNQIMYTVCRSRRAAARRSARPADAIGGLFRMKISRRSVLRYSGLAAAWLALTGCTPTGNASLGSSLPAWMQKALRVSPADSSAASSRPPRGPPPPLPVRRPLRWPPPPCPRASSSTPASA